MNIFKADNTVWFDVDNTLIHHLIGNEEVVVCHNNPFYYEGLVLIKCPYSDESKYYEINQSHVKLLKNCKSQSKQIIVWSAQGWQWCEVVVKSLKIEDYVDLCIGKPHIIVDDKPLDEWPIANLFLKQGFGK